MYSRGLISAMTVPFLTLWPSETFILTIWPGSRKARFEMSSAVDMPAKFLFMAPSDSVVKVLMGLAAAPGACLGAGSPQPHIATAPARSNRNLYLIAGNLVL